MAFDLDQVLALSILLVSALVVSGCTSDPSPRRVAQDIIEIESDRDDTLDKRCLLDQLHEWTNAELDELIVRLEASTPEERREAQDEFASSFAVCLPMTSNSSQPTTTAAADVVDD